MSDEQQQTTGTARSRMRSARPATRKRVHARLALTGPTGSGKTWTALTLARTWAGTAGRIWVIDTESADEDQTASELYSDRFAPFTVIDWSPPYDPRDLAATIKEISGQAGPDDVIIVDSASHFWNKEGGTLEIADGKFQGWGTATPAQDDMVNAFLRSKAHVIVCMRTKMGYAMTTDANGKAKVERVGMEVVQRGDLEYEFTVVAAMDQQHRIEITKTRAEILAGRTFQPNHQEELGELYGEWMLKGVVLADREDRERIRESIIALRATDKDRYNLEAREFKARFGSADQLSADKVREVYAYLVERGLMVVPATTPPEVVAPETVTPEAVTESVTHVTPDGSEPDAEPDDDAVNAAAWAALLAYVATLPDDAIILGMEQCNMTPTTDMIANRNALAETWWQDPTFEIPEEPTPEPEPVETIGDLIEQAAQKRKSKR